MTTFLKELGSTLNIRKNIRPIVLKIREVRIKSRRRILSLNEIESNWPQNNKVFIIYEGKEDAYKLKLCIKFLKNTLDLEPVVHKPSRNSFQINALSSFERLGRDCSAAIVILSTDIETQAVKQNILLEIGYFLGKFHKEKERKIIILHKLYTSIPSDLYDIPCITYHKSIRETFYQLRSQFRYWNSFN
jgi:predicted nucleotide-binding protein